MENGGGIGSQKGQNGIWEREKKTSSEFKTYNKRKT